VVIDIHGVDSPTGSVPPTAAPPPDNIQGSLPIDAHVGVAHAPQSAVPDGFLPVEYTQAVTPHDVRANATTHGSALITSGPSSTGEQAQSTAVHDSLAGTSHVASGNSFQELDSRPPLRDVTNFAHPMERPSTSHVDGHREQDSDFLRDLEIARQESLRIQASHARGPAQPSIPLVPLGAQFQQPVSAHRAMSISSQASSRNGRQQRLLQLQVQMEQQRLSLLRAQIQLAQVESDSDASVPQHNNLGGIYPYYQQSDHRAPRVPHLGTANADGHASMLPIQSVPQPCSNLPPASML
jgi:hypothetical protein